MAKSFQLKHAVWVYVFLNWSALAYAAENTMVSGIESIPAKAIVYVLSLSIVGGAAGTLTKLARPDVAVRNLPLEITKDIFASVVAGMLAYFFTNWKSAGGVSMDFWLQAAIVTIAGYGGSKFLDLVLVDGIGPWLKTILQRILGVAPKDGNGPA